MLSHGYLLPKEQTLPVRHRTNRAFTGIPSVQLADKLFGRHRVRAENGVGFLCDGVDDNELHSGTPFCVSALKYWQAYTCSIE